MQSNAQNNYCCDTGKLERPRYFPRQLVGPIELNLAQDYFRERMRLHNRMLHGWGVVCGAKVSRIEKTVETPEAEQKKDPNASRWEPWMVAVSRGFILGPCGDEILIERDHEINVDKLRNSGDPSEAAYCSEIKVQRAPHVPLYLAVKYKQLQTRPVRTQPVGCGCDETDCEYSRWQDCYEFGILNHCPRDHHKLPASPPSWWKLWMDGKWTTIGGECPDCPPCPDHPWVVLAKFSVDENGNILTEVTPNEWIEGEPDNCECRRLVLSFGNFWWKCSEKGDHYEDERSKTESDEPEEQGDDYETQAQDALRSIAIEDAVSLDAAAVSTLKKASIGSAYDLWEQCHTPHDRKRMSENLQGIGERRLEKWVCQIDVMRPCVAVCATDRIDRLAKLLADDAQIQTVSKLKGCDAKALCRRLKGLYEVLGVDDEAQAIDVMNQIIQVAHQLPDRVTV